MGFRNVLLAQETHSNNSQLQLSSYLKCPVQSFGHKVINMNTAGVLEILQM